MPSINQKPARSGDKTNACSNANYNLCARSPNKKTCQQVSPKMCTILIFPPHDHSENTTDETSIASITIARQSYSRILQKKTHSRRLPQNLTSVGSFTSFPALRLLHRQPANPRGHVWRLNTTTTASSAQNQRILLFFGLK